MADGSVVFEVKADASEAQKNLEKTRKEIEKIQQTINLLESKKSPLDQQAAELAYRLQEARKKAEEYGRQWAAGVSLADRLQGEANQKAEALDMEYREIVSQIDKIDEKLQPAYGEMERLKEQAGAAEREIAAAGAASAKLKDHLKTSQAYMASFVKRVKGLAKRVFVFTLITMALREIREWFGKVIKTNDEASAAVARLKGALLTMAQPLVEVVIPAFIKFADLLTVIVGKIANFLSALSGKTAENAKESAEALYNETEAIEGTGEAAKNASKNLAGFDQLNVLSQETTGGAGEGTIVPDFSWDAGISDFMSQIADAVLIIAAGLATWKVSKLLPTQLSGIISKLAGIIIFIGGAKMSWASLTDAWENGVDWDNFTANLAGIATQVLGLWLAFGKVGSGIGLVINGIASLVVAVKDIFDNGMNLQNLLLALEGIMAGGIGISILITSWIPALIAAIMSILLALVQFTGNGQELIDSLKQILQGFIDFIAGVFTGDWKRAWEGIVNIFKGVLNGVITLFETVVNALVKAFNWIVDQVNKLSFDVPEWVPVIGGKHFGFNFGHFNEIEIPLLAQGGVIPPNREFLAVLGDQKNGTNIEAPLDTIVTAFESVMTRNNAGGGDIVLQIDGKTFARLMNPYTQSEQRRRGVKLVTGGV